jgi:hypothetical protein
MRWLRSVIQREQLVFELPPLGRKLGRIPPIPGRQSHVVLQHTFRPLALIRPQMWRDLFQQVERLSVMDCVGEARRMIGPGGALSRDLTRTDSPEHKLEHAAFRTAYADHKLTILASMPPIKVTVPSPSINPAI